MISSSTETIVSQNLQTNKNFEKENQKREKENLVTGMLPFFLHDTFIEANIEKDGTTYKSKITQIQEYTAENLKNLDMQTIVDSGRIACLIFQNGRCDKLTIHPIWYEKIKEEKAFEVLWQKEKNIGILINKDAKFIKMSEESYVNMLVRLGIIKSE